MPVYNTKDEEIVAYDYDTNLKHSSYVNVSKAAEMLGIMSKEIARSLRDNSVTTVGLYFKVEKRRSFRFQGEVIRLGLAWSFF
jgi:hypothetical protein